MRGKLENQRKMRNRQEGGKEGKAHNDVVLTKETDVSSVSPLPLISLRIERKVRIHSC